MVNKMQCDQIWRNITIFKFFRNIIYVLLVFGIFLNLGQVNVIGKFSFFKKWANPGLFMVFFDLFLQFQYKLKKA